MSRLIFIYFFAFFMSFVLTSPNGVLPTWADEKEPEAAEETKKATEAVNKEKTPAKTKIKKQPKKAAKLSPIESENELTTGDITIDNHGIQAIFINSEVTVHGGTIGGEIHKSVTHEGETEEEDTEGKRPPSGRPSGNGERPERPGDFAKAVEDATKVEGLFTLYEKKGEQLLVEIRPEQMNQDYLISSAFATGVGQGTLKPGAFLGDMIVWFKKVNDSVHMLQRNMRFTVSDDDQELDAVKKNHGDLLVAALPIAATNPENEAHLVDVTKFFISDMFNMTNYVRSSLGGAYGLDGKTSYIEEVKGFPKNIVVRPHYAFRSGNSMGSVQIETVVDIRKLKENPDFQPRPLDDRIGYFIEVMYDFGNVDNRSNLIRHISRWDIQKASPEAEMSPPKEPIVMWLDKNIPEKWREPVRRGILDWNKAFEKIGIKDAVVVKDQPEDAEWDAADARYNTVHWNTSYGEVYGGVAQWIAHPQTGEILNGGFLLEADQIRAVLAIQEYREPDAGDELKKLFEAELPEDHHQFGCEYSQNLVEQAQIGLTMLAAREGIENVTEGRRQEIVDQFLFAIAAHEMGHVLGLRHNFKASTHIALEDIHNREVTSQKSISSSVMDYAPINIAPPGEEQGHYFEPTIGPYDYLAIEYGYKDVRSATEEEKALNQIAEKAEEGELAFGTDEDLYPYGGVDPLINTNDLGNDPLAWGEYMTDSIRNTIPLLPNLVQEGEDYYIVRSAFSRLLNSYYSNAQYAIYYLGGMHTYRLKKGGENELLPLQPVSSEKQREALTFLIEAIFNDELFAFKPELLRMLKGERGLFWGEPFQSISYSVSDTAEAIYDTLLYSLYSPRVVRSIMDAAKQRDPSEDHFTLPEFFDTLNEGIWREVYQLAESDADNAGRRYTNEDPFLSIYRRSLQRIHLKLLIRTMLEPPFNMPDDARTQAWRMVTELENRIEGALEEMEAFEEIDMYTHAHLAESLEKIDRALEARVSVSIDLW